MLIEINLLPKKAKKNFSLPIVIALLASFFLLSTGLLYYYSNSLKSTADTLNADIQRLDESIRLEQEQMQQVQATNSVLELKKAVEWAKTYPIKSVPVLQHVTSLLPERGFIQNYSYSQDGKVGLTVQFDTSREAAYYLNWLKESDWVAEANILSLGISGTTDRDTLPRYIGQFEITIANDKVREIINKGEGGDS
jgi:type IV pilus assembly protein PilN